jgi:hypothetical protein
MFEGWRNPIELQKTDGLLKGMRWFVLFIFLINWYTWFLLFSRHWAEMWNHVAMVWFLVLSPVPCILMFFRREVYPPVAAFLTYSLLGVAFLVATCWRS